MYISTSRHFAPVNLLAIHDYFRPCRCKINGPAACNLQLYDLIQHDYRPAMPSQLYRMSVLPLHNPFGTRIHTYIHMYKAPNISITTKYTRTIMTFLAASLYYLMMMRFTKFMLLLSSLLPLLSNISAFPLRFHFDLCENVSSVLCWRLMRHMQIIYACYRCMIAELNEIHPSGNNYPQSRSDNRRRAIIRVFAI